MNRRTLTATFIMLAAALALPGQPKPKSQAEFEAVKALFAAQDPDGRIKAADDLVTKYADTEFKALALYIEAASWQEKNDIPKMTVYAERALEADPKDYKSMLMLANAIAQQTREHDLDRDEKLARAEKYANSAMEILKDAPKPNPQVTDDQWTAAKKDYGAEAHRALGIVALTRKKPDVAIAEFKTAVEGAATPDPSDKVRLGAAYNQGGRYDDAIAVLDKVMADPSTSPTLRQFAQAERARSLQAKNGVAKAPQTAAPAQVEIKKP